MGQKKLQKIYRDTHSIRIILFFFISSLFGKQWKVNHKNFEIDLNRKMFSLYAIWLLEMSSDHLKMISFRIFFFTVSKSMIKHIIIIAMALYSGEAWFISWQFLWLKNVWHSKPPSVGQSAKAFTPISEIHYRYLHDCVIIFHWGGAVVLMRALAHH